MKRFMLQLLRLIVTLIIMGTMAMMIFSLREENAELRRQLAQARVKGTPDAMQVLPVDVPAENPPPKNK